VNAGTNALTIGAAGTLDTSGSLSVGNFTSAGTITNTAANTITSSGNVAISNSFSGTAMNGTLVMTGATATLNAAVQLGNLQLNSTATGGVSTDKQFEPCGELEPAELVGARKPGALGITVSGTTTIAGTLNAGSGTDSFAAVGGTGSLSASTGTTTISGNLSVTSFTHNNGTVSFTGGTHGAYSFYNVTIAGTVSSGGAWTIGNDLTITSGAWTAGAYTHAVGRNWTNSVGTAGFVGAGSTIQFTGAVTHAITGANELQQLERHNGRLELKFRSGQDLRRGRVTDADRSEREPDHGQVERRSIDVEPEQHGDERGELRVGVRQSGDDERDGVELDGPDGQTIRTGTLGRSPGKRREPLTRTSARTGPGE